MGDVVTKRKRRDVPKARSLPGDDAVPVHAKVVPHPDREERLKSGIRDLSANFPTARQRASDAILKLIDVLSAGDHKLESRRAEALKIKLIRALAVLEAIHNRPESVSADELEHLKQAMALLHEVGQRQAQVRSADSAPKSGLLN